MESFKAQKAQPAAVADAVFAKVELWSQTIFLVLIAGWYRRNGEEHYIAGYSELLQQLHDI